MLKKGLVVVVIFLFIGIAFAPSINANVSKSSLDKETVEFTTEICGLNGGKQTVKLTQEEAEEVGQLFDSIKERLDKTETREGTVEIFKEAVVELDKYGLLGDLSVKDAYRLVIGGSSAQKTIVPNSLAYHNKGFFCISNFCCLIVGNSSNMGICGFRFWAQNNLLAGLIYIFLWLEDNGFDLENDKFWLLINTLWDIVESLGMVQPLYFGYVVENGFTHYYPSRGWVWALGLFGITKTKDDKFYGQIRNAFAPEASVFPAFGYVGAIGFTGLIFNRGVRSFYIGSALYVSLCSNPPFLS